MKTIKIRIKTVYGNKVYVPANRDAQLLADIAGTKTLTLNALKNCKELGFDIAYTQDDIEELEALLNGGREERLPF